VSEEQKQELRLIAYVILLSLVVGYFSGYLLLSLLVGVLAYTARHIYYFFNFNEQLGSQDVLSPPFPSGLWGEIYKRTHQLQSRSIKHRRKLVRFTDRFMEAASEIEDALVILGSHQEVEWANHAAHRLLGIDWPGDRGKPLTSIVNYPFLQEHLDASEFSQPLEFSPPHDRSLVISVRLTPFGGEKSQRLVFTRDITQLYHLNHTRRDFVANVSHELRTPLSVISGFIENLIYADKLPIQEKPLNLMHKQAQRMQTLIEDLITLSRLEMDQSKSQQEEVQIPELLDELIYEGVTLSGDKAHVFQQDIDPGLRMLGDRRELYSAFSNLIFNAVKYTPRRAIITIRWGLDEEGPVFSVSDTGEGIPERHIPRLTERFYRVDSSHSSRSGGTGLGLAIVKYIIQRHGGELHITSKVGLGSTFSCHFPGDSLLHTGFP